MWKYVFTRVVIKIKTFHSCRTCVPLVFLVSHSCAFVSFVSDTIALAIFDQSTFAAIESYYPNRLDVSSSLKLVNIWWTRIQNKLLDWWRSSWRWQKTFVLTRIYEMAGGLAKSAEQKFSKLHLEQANRYCSCHYSPMYCVPYWRSCYGKVIQICFNVSVPNRLSGVKTL